MPMAEPSVPDAGKIAGDVMSDRATEFIGDTPSFYDRGLGPVFFADFADDIARRVTASAPGRVLELAAGTGIVSRKLRDLLPPEAELTATDLNPPMLEVARGKFRPGERVAFRPADAGALPFPDGSFDAIACQFGVMFFPDKDEAYREAHRVLTPGGRYVFSVWDSHRHNPVGRLITEIVAGFFPVDPPQFYQVPFGYHRIDPIKDSLEAAGFSEIRIAVLRIDKRVADAAAFTRALVYGNPLIEQIRARGGVDPERVVDAFAKALPREFGSEPMRMPLQAIVVEARRQ
jgi:ubiquinone/menaquinone biosynthesis C-methylase UbiE